MSCITVRGCVIGQGRPKVILPIVEETEQAVLAQGQAFAQLAADCIEFRADWFAGWRDAAALSRCLTGLRAAPSSGTSCYWSLCAPRRRAAGQTPPFQNMPPFAAACGRAAAPTSWTSSSSPPGPGCPA